MSRTTQRVAGPATEKPPRMRMTLLAGAAGYRKRECCSSRRLDDEAFAAATAPLDEYGGGVVAKHVIVVIEDGVDELAHRLGRWCSRGRRSRDEVGEALLTEELAA